jgi:DNA repair protein RadC
VQGQDHQAGHRTRLRQRFLAGGSSAINDYELLEMILFASNARSDVKPLAKDLLKIFHSFSGVIQAPAQELLKVKGLGQAGVATIKVIQLASEVLSRDSLKKKPLLSSWEAVINYCKLAMGHLKIEQLRLLFLDRQHQLIVDEVHQQGTIDHTPVYIREIIKRALEVGAAGIIVVHNHPSGDPTPSKADITVTREIEEAASIMGIMMHDHIIIGQSRYTSLRGQGLI